MIGYEVEIKGLDEQLRKLEAFPRVASEEYGRAMGYAVAAIERGGKENAPVGATGELRSQIGSEVRQMPGGDVEGIVRASAPHSAAMEFGAKPHYPNIENLSYWVLRKLGISGEETMTVTYRIARAIAARGLAAREYMKKGFENAQPAIDKQFADATDHITERLAVRSGGNGD